MDGETPSLPNAAQGMTATHHPYRWQQRLRLPIKTPRPSRAAIPGRDRVLSVPMCLIRQPREMDGETPSLPNAAQGMDGDTPSLPNAVRESEGENAGLPS